MREYSIEYIVMPPMGVSPLAQLTATFSDLRTISAPYLPIQQQHHGGGDGRGGIYGPQGPIVSPNPDL